MGRAGQLRSARQPGREYSNCTATANDFAQFLITHSNIRLLVFNGQKAQQLFRKFVPMKDEDGVLQHIASKVLPSTSPAYAAMPFSGKLNAWKTAFDGASETD